MTRAMKITFLAAAVLGLGLGGYFGHASADQTSDSLESIPYVVPLKVISDFARVQFMHADTDHARQAAMLQIHVLEQLDAADKTSHANGELGFAYTRLGMIEEAAGKVDAERGALAEAKASFKRYNPDKEPTDDELKSALLRRDSFTSRAQISK